MLQDPDGLYWCSTRVNKKNRMHIGGKGHWGYCQPGCDAKPVPIKVSEMKMDFKMRYID